MSSSIQVKKQTTKLEFDQGVAALKKPTSLVVDKSDWCWLVLEKGENRQALVEKIQLYLDELKQQSELVASLKRAMLKLHARKDRAKSSYRANETLISKKLNELPKQIKQAELALKLLAGERSGLDERELVLESQLKQAREATLLKHVGIAREINFQAMRRIHHNSVEGVEFSKLEALTQELFKYSDKLNPAVRSVCDSPLLVAKHAAIHERFLAYVNDAEVVAYNNALLKPMLRFYHPDSGLIGEKTLAEHLRYSLDRRVAALHEIKGCHDRLAQQAHRRASLYGIDQRILTLFLRFNDKQKKHLFNEKEWRFKKPGWFSAYRFRRSEDFLVFKAAVEKVYGPKAKLSDIFSELNVLMVEEQSRLDLLKVTHNEKAKQYAEAVVKVLQASTVEKVLKKEVIVNAPAPQVAPVLKQKTGPACEPKVVSIASAPTFKPSHDASKWKPLAVQVTLATVFFGLMCVPGIGHLARSREIVAGLFAIGSCLPKDVLVSQFSRFRHRLFGAPQKHKDNADAKKVNSPSLG